MATHPTPPSPPTRAGRRRGRALSALAGLGMVAGVLSAPALTSVPGLGPLAAGATTAGATTAGATTAGATTAAATTAAPMKVFSCGQVTAAKGAGGQKRQQATAILGTTKAMVSGPTVKSSYGSGPLLGSPELQVWSGGKEIYKGPLAVPSADRIPSKGGIQAENVASSGALCVASFTGANPETGVFMGMFSGGAHCCFWADTYVVRAGKVVTPPIEHDYGDPGLGLKASAGSTVLLTADDAFAYAFDSYAASGLPLVVLTLQGTKLVTVTKQYPSWVTSDAKVWWSAFQQAQQPKYEGKGGGLGLLAAWVADECNLGTGPGASAWAKVAKLQSEGRLSGGNETGLGLPTGAKYVSALHTFLSKHGYC